jgi:hypothetical protein
VPQGLVLVNLYCQFQMQKHLGKNLHQFSSLVPYNFNVVLVAYHFRVTNVGQNSILAFKNLSFDCGLVQLISYTLPIFMFLYYNYGSSQV